MRRALVLAVAATLLVGGGAIASSATPTIDGNDADDGPLRIDVGAESGVSPEDGDRLLIDASGGSATGLAVDARYTFGDAGAPTDRPAFTITNADDRIRDVTIGYAGTTGDGPAENVRLLVYDAAGDRVATATEEGGRVTVSGVEPDETLYAVVVVDTHGLTPDADLSGTVTVRS